MVSGDTKDVRKKDLWQVALGYLNQDERALIEGVRDKSQSQHDVLKSALVAVERKKTECIKKRWKVVVKGRTIILRDVFEKMSVWISNFVDVANSIMAWQSPQVTLPWAAIRFFLDIGVNDVQGFERRSLTFLEDFEHALVSFYAEVLKYFAKVTEYFGQNTAKRLIKSIVVDSAEINSWTESIYDKQESILRYADLAQREQLTGIEGSIETLSGALQDRDKASIELNERLCKSLADLQKPINRLDDRLKTIDDNLKAQERTEILKSISKIPYPAHHKRACKGRLQHSGRWLLDKGIFREWLSESSSSVLWLHSIPGAGKTKLVSLVIDELQAHNHLVYFYCTRNPAEPERAQCDAVLASFVRQLASAGPRLPILDPVKEKYQADQEAFDGFEDEDHAWTAEDSTDVLLKLCKLYPSTIFVLDALDEVEDRDRTKILAAFRHIMNASPNLVKIFISSRDSADIVRHLKDSPNLYIGVDDNSEDIARFVREKLVSSELLNGELPIEVMSSIEQTLTRESKGMFRWAELQIEALRVEKSVSDIKDRLGRLPATLEDLYWEIYEQIRRYGASAQKLAKLVIQWLLYSERQISLPEFVLLASTWIGEQVTQSQILDICGNLIVVQDYDFRFAHLSVREFFESLPKPGRDVHDFLRRPSQAVLTSVCLTRLLAKYAGDETRDGLTVNGSNFDTASTLDLEIMHVRTLALDLYNVRLQVYADDFWINHAIGSGQLIKQEPLKSLLKSFLFHDNKPSLMFDRWCLALLNRDGINHGLITYGAAEVQNPIWIAYSFELLEPGDVIVLDDHMERDALRQAVAVENIPVLGSLLERHSGRAAFGEEAFFTACNLGKPRVVEILSDKGIKPTGSALNVAIRRGDQDLVDCIIQRFGTDHFDRKQWSDALTMAVTSGVESFVQLCIEAGAVRDTLAIHRVLRAGLSASALQLINHDFDVCGSSGFDERTTLHWSAYHGFEQVTSQILAKGVPVGAIDIDGNTALHLAARQGHKRIVPLLIKHGARLDVVNSDNLTPLQVAIHAGKKVVIPLLDGKVILAGDENHDSPTTGPQSQSQDKTIPPECDPPMQLNLNDSPDVEKLFTEISIGTFSPG